MKVSEILLNAQLAPVTRGKNLRAVGWWAGYLVVRFRGKDTLWVYGPEIAEVEKDKILRVPYPDRQFNSIKKKYRAYKVERAA